MEPKKISQSRITMTHQTLPVDANPYGNVHGGVVAKLIDTAGGVVAMRHCQGNAVTASIDRLDFLTPIKVGDVVHVKASLNMVGSTSMEVGVRVEAENIQTGRVRHAVSAYLTYVALDDTGRPAKAPELVLETETDRRRNAEAKARRELRKAERMRERTI